MPRRYTRYIILATVVVATVAIIVYSSFDPLKYPFPKCPFLLLTGWKCPGCGAQRAIHAFLNGNFIAAWNFNPALFIGVPLAALYAVAEIETKPTLALKRSILSAPVLWGLLLLIFAWWFARNIFDL